MTVVKTVIRRLKVELSAFVCNRVHIKRMPRGNEACAANRLSWLRYLLPMTNFAIVASWMFEVPS